MFNDYRKKAPTYAEAVRDLLGRLEAQLGKLPYLDKAELLALPPLFDQTHTLIEDLRRDGTMLSGEQTRFDSAVQKWLQNGKLFLRAIGGRAALEAARPVPAPHPQRVWWYVDREQDARQRATRQRVAGMVAAGAAVFLLLAFLYQRYLAPDPQTRARFQYQQNAEHMTLNGNYPAALESVEQALALAPDDLGLLVLKGVLQEQLQQPAADTFAAAQHSGPATDFRLTRARWYLVLQRTAAAHSDLDALLVLDPQSPNGYYLLGQLSELEGDYAAADAYYRQGADFAAAAGNTQLEALIRIQRAQMLQQAPLPTPGVTQ